MSANLGVCCWAPALLLRVPGWTPALHKKVLGCTSALYANVVGWIPNAAYPAQARQPCKRLMNRDENANGRADVIVRLVIQET